MTSTDDFDWEKDDSVLIRHQPATAIYENCRGLITLRQEQGEFDDQDTIIVVAPENAEVVASALARLAREILAARSCFTEKPRAPKSKTNGAAAPLLELAAGAPVP